MEPTQSQGQLSPDEAAASLAFATHLQGQMIPQQEATDAPVESPEAPGEEQSPETPESAPFDPEAFKEEMKKELKNDIKEELSNFKEDLIASLSDEEDK